MLQLLLYEDSRFSGKTYTIWCKNYAMQEMA